METVNIYNKSLFINNFIFKYCLVWWLMSAGGCKGEWNVPKYTYFLVCYYYIIYPLTLSIVGYFNIYYELKRQYVYSCPDPYSRKLWHHANFQPPRGLFHIRKKGKHPEVHFTLWKKGKPHSCSFNLGEKKGKHPGIHFTLGKRGNPQGFISP